MTMHPITLATLRTQKQVEPNLGWKTRPNKTGLDYIRFRRGSDIVNKKNQIRVG